MSAFTAIEMAPRDPILGLTEQFNADTRPAKVNLAMGVYCDEQGRLPLLQCVRAAGHALLEAPRAHAYLPIDGLAAYDAAVRSLVFGEGAEPLSSGRVATVQSLGGTGGLKLGADFLRRLSPAAAVLISDPSWENHRALFTQAGFAVGTYPYHDATGHGIDFAGMLEALAQAVPGTVVVLHACCHNPTGYDLAPAQWDEVVAVCKQQRLVPFLDLAYQGFGRGLAEDGAVVHKFAAAGMGFLVSTSFSKSFSLYGERVGALSVVCADRGEASRALSQLKVVARTNYSSPPAHGAAIVSAVLHDAALRKLWEQELGGMRTRIQCMRRALVDGLQAAGVRRNMGFITGQAGMFSYSGLSRDQMARLRDEFGVYGTDTGRMCVAGLNDGNIGHVCASIAEVIR